MTRHLIALLPPSETKKDGGSAAFSGALLAGLRAWTGQDAPRAEALRLLVELARDPGAHAGALKLSPAQAERELARNASLASAPRMPALERYTGVLYDALDAAGLDAEARRRAGERLAIQSALFGLLGADDPIPAYRCSASTRLGSRSMGARWARAGAAALASWEGPILDLRSKAYAALAPLPDRDDAVVAEVVTRMPDGELKALSHFNKRAKGELARAIALAPVPALAALDGARDAHELGSALGALGVEAQAAGERELLIVADDPRTGARSAC